MEEKQIQIKAKDEDLKGVYANLMIVRHSKEEFCLDFINSFDPATLTARVMTSPAHLKRMIQALNENMKQYEDEFGPVEAAEQRRPVGFDQK